MYISVSGKEVRARISSSQNTGLETDKKLFPKKNPCTITRRRKMDIEQTKRIHIHWTHINRYLTPTPPRPCFQTSSPWGHLV
jgi:hypothetical protein